MYTVLLFLLILLFAIDGSLAAGAAPFLRLCAVGPSQRCGDCACNPVMTGRL